MPRREERELRGRKQSAENKGEFPTLDAQKLLSEPIPTAERVVELSLDCLVRSRFDPRTRALTRAEVGELMASIEANGQTAPIIVQPAPEEGEGKYYVEGGNRRCAALRFLGRQAVTAIIRTDLDERSARKLALADNLAREDLTAFEQAKALGDYCDAFGLTIEAAGEELGVKPRTAFRLKGILSAPEPLQYAIREHRISAKAADLLCKVAKRWPKKAVRLADKVATGKMTLKALEAEASTGRSRAPRKAAEAQDVVLKVEPHLLTLKLQLSQEERTDEQLRRVREALSRVARHLGLDDIGVAPIAPPGDAAATNEGASEADA